MKNEITFVNGPRAGQTIQDYRAAGDVIPFDLPVFEGGLSLSYDVVFDDAKLIARLGKMDEGIVKGYETVIRMMLLGKYDHKDLLMIMRLLDPDADQLNGRSGDES